MKTTLGRLDSYTFSVYDSELPFAKDLPVDDLSYLLQRFSARSSFFDWNLSL